MVIKYLKLFNFRQFVDEQIINFSTDSDKKVTLVIAESGVGKTTLIQSFQWVLYGTCKYKSLINTDIKNSMPSNSETEVKGTLALSHNNSDYKITRTQKYAKMNKQVQSEPSFLSIDIKDDSGITTQVKGREADKIIKELMHQDLFPYFFLEGESLTKVGEQMSQGKSGTNSEFVKAIKGLLGFNFLYEASKHLQTVSDQYKEEIKKNSNDARLNWLIENIKINENKIKNLEDRIGQIDNEVSYYSGKREELNDKIIKYSGIDEKQKRTKKLANELLAIQGKIIEQKKYVFKKFSSCGFKAVMNALLVPAEEALKNSNAIDKGIPGMDVKAVEYMLANHKCICGHELIEDSDEWNELKKWITFLPPNNIGLEIKNFKQQMNDVARSSEEFVSDFEKARIDLNDFLKEYQRKVDELNKLNEEISGVNEDVGLLKEQESKYNAKLVELNSEKNNKNILINNCKSEIEKFEKEQSGYKFINEKVARINSYLDESENLRSRINLFCQRKEREKRQALSDAINGIFRDFYEEKITFSLDSNYGVNIRTSDLELSDEFTSGGQDVAVALAFIGAIIKLNRMKDEDPDAIDDNYQTEAYPLVMDAPTSNFGMKQMASFSEVMPKITDQIIVFINDKDGPILRSKMFSHIGSEWSLVKSDSYHSSIEEVARYGK